MRGLVSIALVGLVGCGGAREAAPDPVEGSAFICEDPSLTSETPMRRLSRTQYEHTLVDAVERLGGDSLLMSLQGDLATLLAQLPDDHADRALQREVQQVSQVHAEQWYRIAQRVGDAVAEAPLHCAEPGCVEAFVQTVGARLMRRPLPEAEVRFFVDVVYATAPSHRDGIRDLVTVWLASPSFTHQVEHGEPGVVGDTVPLTAHELANRLALHAWNAPPDDELWELAVSGDLLETETFEAQVARVFADPRAQQARERFFTDWLELDTLPRLDTQVGEARYDAFRGEIEPSSDLHLRVRDDVLDLLQWHIDNGSTLDEVLVGAQNTVMDPEVAALYGVPAMWDGVSAPETLATGHGGLLTRPAFHITGTTNTRPIHKGVLLRRRLLCDPLGDPPADLGEEPEIDETASQRTRTEQLTEIEGSVCLACHAQINPLGYLTENFDGLGRFRDTEFVFADDGAVVGTHSVDATVEVAVDDDVTALTGPGALSQALAESPKTDACVARFWFRHTAGRQPDDAVDGCVLQNIEQQLASGQSLDAALRVSALDPSFRVRRFDEGGAQ